MRGLSSKCQRSGGKNKDSGTGHEDINKILSSMASYIHIKLSRLIAAYLGDLHRVLDEDKSIELSEFIKKNEISTNSDHSTQSSWLDKKMCAKKWNKKTGNIIRGHCMKHLFDQSYVVGDIWQEFKHTACTFLKEPQRPSYCINDYVSYPFEQSPLKNEESWTKSGICNHIQQIFGRTAKQLDIAVQIITNEMEAKLNEDDKKISMVALKRVIAYFEGAKSAVVKQLNMMKERRIIDSALDYEVEADEIGVETYRRLYRLIFRITE